MYLGFFFFFLDFIFGCCQYINLYFYYILLNLSLLMTTLGKISGAATEYIIIIWLSQYHLNPNFRALELGV